VEKANIDPRHIGDIVCGNVCNPGAGANEHRAAALHAGIPYEVPFQAVNRQCGSGLMAANDIANKISTHQIDIGIGAGVESMSLSYNSDSFGLFPESFKYHPIARDGVVPMGITSENVAENFEISRREQDEFAALSYQKAAAGQDAGLFKDEIIPLKVWLGGSEVVVDTDDGIRRGVTPETLSKVRPAY
jgi:acetyl-CoA acyltransferase 1